MPVDTNTKYKKQIFKTIGTRPPRPDGIDKVTGRAKYGADTFAPGQLTARVLRSPHAHARIVRIDTSKAEKLKGVKAVITSADLPDLTNANRTSFDILENCMARDRALYHGHAVAAVAAVDVTTAREALRLINVQYEVLPHVTDVDLAMSDQAPIVQPRVRYENKPSNVVKRSEFGHGDIDTGFEQADVIIEQSYKTEQAHQGYIEPHACLASVGPDGQGELWVTTQGPHTYRAVCAELLGMDMAHLKVTPSEIGGGFGGKTHVWTEPLALALSRKANRPVKLVMDREEVFLGTGPTCSASIDVKIGAKRDGTITAALATMRYQSGPYAGPWGTYGGMAAFACYNLKNVKTVAYDVLVNRPKVAAYRAPSAPMAAFAVESTVDQVASTIGMSPLDIRIKNAAVDGTRASFGPTYGTIGLRATLDAVAQHPHLQAPLKANQGRGIACAFWFTMGGQTSTDLNISIDGTVNLTVGTVDVGGARAAMSMIAAEELGVRYNQVQTVVADTSSLGHNDTTEGSRGTFSSGMATIFAARQAIEVLKQRAALMWQIELDAVQWTAGAAHAQGEAHAHLGPLTLAEIARSSATTGGPIAGHSEIVADGAGASFATHICDVEVDPETGATRIIRYTAIQDVGKAVHPDYVEGQFQGGAAQGIGWALNEEYVYGDDGRLLNPQFLDYRMPVCSDLPFIDTQIVEIPNPTHPYGIRGVGETSIIPPLAAVGNAIADATGVRMSHAPMTPPRLLKAIKAQ